MLTGNKGEWSEPYALLKLLADGKLYLGDSNFNKIPGIVYEIIKVLRHEKDRNVEFTRKTQLIFIRDGKVEVKVPIVEFVNNAKTCFEEIKKGNGAFPIPAIEAFLSSFLITSLKAKSKLKNDITIQIEDPNSFLSPALGFSIKSQLGEPATLVNASGATNFTFKIEGGNFTPGDISRINETRLFSNKIKEIKRLGARLQFEDVDNHKFRSNLQTIDTRFAEVLADIIVLYYSNAIASENTVPKFIDKVSVANPLGYDLITNPIMYEMLIKKFLTDYALGMRAAEVWQRNYQATGGYLIVKDDGDLLCYHFYFMKSFEDYLFRNTKLETGDPGRLSFGKIYSESGVLKMKLNLQVRFIQ